MSDVTYASEAGRVRTTGLAAARHPELMVEVSDESLVPDAEEFLRHVVSYLERRRTRIESEQTMPYGYWFVRWRDDGDGVLAAWEYDAPYEQLRRGATLTLTYRRDQLATCERVGAAFSPPLGDRMAAIDPRVLDGALVNGTRYPAPEHMSGWWFISDTYDGDTSKLRVDHLYHVTAARPDLARYLALPAGYRFNLAGGDDRVWFEEEVSRESAG